MQYVMVRSKACHKQNLQNAVLLPQGKASRNNSRQLCGENARKVKQRKHEKMYVDRLYIS